MSRWTILVVVILAIGSVVYLTSKPTPILVDTATATLGDVHDFVDERGKTRLPEIYRITMPLDGRIERVTLQERDAVTAGQIVAQIDPDDLQTDLDSSAARVDGFDKMLESMRLTVQTATEQIAAGEAKFRYADNEFKRKSALAERKAISESARDEAELLQFEARVDLLKDQLTEKAMQSLVSAMELLRREADETRKKNERDRNRTELESPVDGVILKRHVTNKRHLRSGDPVLEIGRLEDLEVEAELLTQDAARVSVGDPVEISGPSVGATPVSGKVTRIYPQGFKKISSLGVEQQRVLVIIGFDEGEKGRLESAGIRLGADYRVRVRIVTDTHSNVVRIPRAALFRDADGNWNTFVIRAGRARRVTLEVGIINDFHAEIVTGVKQDDQVIIAPETDVEDNSLVESRRGVE